jgi:hypothetical protein
MHVGKHKADQLRPYEGHVAGHHKNDIRFRRKKACMDARGSSGKGENIGNHRKAKISIEAGFPAYDEDFFAKNFCHGSEHGIHEAALPKGSQGLVPPSVAGAAPACKDNARAVVYHGFLPVMGFP